MATVSSPLRDAVRFHWRAVLRWMFFFCGPAALFYLIVVYSLSYVTGTLGVPKQDRLRAADGRQCLRHRRRHGRRPAERPDRRASALAIGSIATLLILFVYFPILDTK